MIHIYLLFIQWKLPAFAKFNKFLQTEEPLIHCLHDELQKTKKTENLSVAILLRFGRATFGRGALRIVITIPYVRFTKLHNEYCVNWLPLDEPVYVNTKFINFLQGNPLTFAEVTNIVTRFPEGFKDCAQDLHVGCS